MLIGFEFLNNGSTRTITSFQYQLEARYFEVRTTLARQFKMKSLMLSILLAIFYLTIVKDAETFEIRYKVCSSEELSKSVKQVCMRLAARDGNSDLSISPYGSLSVEFDGSEGVDLAPLSDSALLEILKLSRPYHRGRKYVMQQQVRHQPLYKRSADNSNSELSEYLKACCNQSCLIDPKHLDLYCPP